METRLNVFGQKEVKIQPKGLPVIWVEMYCKRCRPFQECLGYKELSDSEWREVNAIIASSNTPIKIKKSLQS